MNMSKIWSRVRIGCVSCYNIIYCVTKSHTYIVTWTPTKIEMAFTNNDMIFDVILPFISSYLIFFLEKK